MFNATIEILRASGPSEFPVMGDVTIPGNVTAATTKLAEYMARERLAGVCLEKIREFYDHNDPAVVLLEEKLFGFGMQTLLQTQRKLSVYAKIREALKPMGITPVALKGMALACAYYPDMSYRPMRDLDILVEPTAIDKASEAIAHLAGTVPDPVRAIDTARAHRLEIRIDGVSVEPHHHLFGLANKRNLEVDFGKDVVEVSTAAGPVAVLRPHIMLYHLAAHFSITRLFEHTPLGWLEDMRRVAEQGKDGIPNPVDFALNVNKSMTKELKPILAAATGKEPITENLRKLRQKGLGETIGQFFRSLPILIPEIMRRTATEDSLGAKIQRVKYEVHEIVKRNTPDD